MVKCVASPAIKTQRRYSLKIKIVTSFIMLLFLVACAGPKVNVVDEGGRQFPNPHYIMKSLNNEISALFYYTAYTTEDDLDGQIIPVPNYLKIHETYSFSKKKYHRLTLTVEVQNPVAHKYELWERSTFKKNGQIETSRGKRIAYSNRVYRSYVFELPYDNSEYEKVRYGIYMVDEKGNILLSFGELRYSIH
jgi:hypothetical protein